jgi:hypothetical protein
MTIPHLYKPRSYQLPFLKAMDSGINRAILVWNRRSGKDKTCFNFMIKKAFEKVGTYFYFLPTYSQAKKVVWDNIDNNGFKMLEHIPKELIKGSNATELKIELINGSIIQLIAGDEFKKSGVGTNPVGVVFSEFSITDPEAWKYVSPILAVNGGWAVFNFTPRGMNHAHHLLNQYKDNPKWFVEILTNNETQVLTGDNLEEERNNNPQDFFEQEYYCKFIEGAGQFFKRIRQNTYPKDTILPEDGDFQLGVDLAKYNDWTVLTPFNLNTFIAYPQDRFNQIDYNLQKAKIEALARRMNDALLMPDSTGVGDPIVEDLKNRGLRVCNDGEGFKFTEQSRKNLLNNLAIKLEQDKIKIPDDEGLIGELESFQYVMGETGKIKVQVPDGLHDDRVMSLALAVWGVSERIRPDPFQVNRILQNRERSTKQMFN